MDCPSETRLQAFVDGQLEAEDIDALSRHLDGCDDCRTLVGMVQPVTLDDQTQADRVGRYVLRRVLGKGGMGVVYEAIDPELHREVALKVLRPDLDASPQRLLGEAQSMAKLSHPNVVAIHDVGRDGERVFIVMALVRGSSLRHWLAREPRPLADVLAAFEQAAEGLHAAHEAGLVHRDFKAENVFVDGDGPTLRVLVGDFGLAVSGALDGRAAQEGSLATMAPEQRRGESVDARSDQYSFCLVLDEAIAGSREGRAAAPRWLVKLVARGMQEKPSDRFPSMAALLEAMAAGRQRSRSRRLVAIAIGAVAVLGIGTAVAARTGGASHPLCRHADVGPFDAGSATRIEAAFRATRSPLADDAWRRTKSTLLDYGAGWESARVRMCAARPAPAASLQCLADRREVLRAVTASLEKADASMLEQVPAMLQLLPRVGGCDDGQELGPAPPPEKAAEVDATKKQIALASATIAAGRYKDGLALADQAWTRANATGFLPVMAEAYLWVGTAHGRLGETQKAEQALEHAVSSASAARVTPTAVRAWIQLVHFVGYEAKRYDDGFRWAEYAKAALGAMPRAFDLEAERLAWSRAMLLDQKRYDEALSLSRQELALVELEIGKNDLRAASALDGLAGGLAGQCKPRDALVPQEKACAILEKELGHVHPQLALCLGNLAALRANLGEHDTAMLAKERALAMFVEVPGHPNHVAMAHRNMARSQLELGRLTAARHSLDAAAALGKRESDETSVMILRGELLRREGKKREAFDEHARAVARTENAEPARRIEPLVALAESALAAERLPDALASAERAVAAATAAYGATSCRLAEPLRLQSSALVAVGRKGEALPLAERASAVLADAQVDPKLRARVDAALAEAR